MDFEGLPEYETTDEEDENEEGEETSTVGADDPAEVENQLKNQARYPQNAQNLEELEQMGINSPTPHTRLNAYNKSGENEHPMHITNNDLQYPSNHAPQKSNIQKNAQKPMNQKDYQSGMKYIE